MKRFLSMIMVVIFLVCFTVIPVCAADTGIVNQYNSVDIACNFGIYPSYPSSFSTMEGTHAAGNSGYVANVDATVAEDDPDAGNFTYQLDFYNDDFDYITVYLYLTVAEITSISAVSDTEALDVETSFIQSTNDSGKDVFNLTVKINTSNADSIVRLYIDGRVFTGTNSFFIYNCSGLNLVGVEGPTSDFMDTVTSGLSDIFTKMQEGFTNMVTSIQDGFYELISVLRPEATPDADDFQAGVDQQTGDLNNITGALENMDKPDLNEFSGDISEYVVSADLMEFTSPLQVFFDNQIILSIFCISLTLMLGSYVLYGKR